MFDTGARPGNASLPTLTSGWSSARSNARFAHLPNRRINVVDGFAVDYGAGHDAGLYALRPLASSGYDGVRSVVGRGGISICLR